MDVDAQGRVPGEILELIEGFLTFGGVDEREISIGIQGGYGRGQYSPDSDIDLVFAVGEGAPDISRLKGSSAFGGHTFEVRVVDVDRLRIREMLEKQRYIYANETLIYKDLPGRLTGLVEGARMSEEEQLGAIVLMVRKLANMGLVYHNRQGEWWRGFQWERTQQYWVERGDLISAHCRLNEGTGRLIRLIYALNRQFLPSLKWRYHILLSLPWTPPCFEQDLKELLTIRAFDKEDFDRRTQAGISILDSCIDKAIADGCFPEDFGEYYNGMGERYTDNRG